MYRQAEEEAARLASGRMFSDGERGNDFGGRVHSCRTREEEPNLSGEEAEHRHRRSPPYVNFPVCQRNGARADSAAL